MRDLFRPVSAPARQRGAANPASPFSGFGLMSDEVLTPGDGVRGVRVVYRYRIAGGPTQGLVLRRHRRREPPRPR
ncbi:MAG TPA: hypothetical protein VFE39_00930 [Pseudonocardia sp.]|jgi:hypothetical protein|nr:hypothetical protein [Pseudonocardia sp.]